MSQTGLMTPSASVNGLANGTKYYWQVNAANQSGGTSVWATAWSFTTVEHAPTVPALSSPTNNALSQPTSLTLSWTSASYDSSYTVQVATISSFTTILFNQTGVATSASVSGLSSAIMYYWRVNAANQSAGTTSWSGSWSFTTVVVVANAPGVPTLSSPANNAQNQPTTLTLSWTSANYDSSYTVQLSTVSTFTSSVQTLSGWTFTFEGLLTGLSNVTTYYWRVNAANQSGGTSVWATAWSFTTVEHAPATPGLSSPTNNAQNQLTSLTLSWASAGNDSSYTVRVSTVSTFLSTVLSQSGMTATALPLIGLANTTTYYWRVNSANQGGGTSSWSGLWSFTTLENAPSVPGLYSPANNALNQPTTLTLSWTAGSLDSSYTVQVSTVPTFLSTVLSQSGMNTTAFPLIGLAFGTSYYWRVNSAIQGGGASGWSGTWGFVTIAVPATPALVSPANTATFTDYQPVTVVWSTVANATYYTVRVGTSAGFANPFLYQSQVNTYVLIIPPHGQVYYWEVSASNATGTGAWSSVWTLTPSTSVVPSLLLDNTYKFSMKQGVIVYSLPRAEQVEFSLCDMLGRTAMTLNRRQAAGSYSINVKGSSLAAGQYFVRFKAGAFEKKAVIMLTR